MNYRLSAMHLKGLLFLLFTFFTISTNAQDWSKDTYQYGELYEGYIIDLEGNKTEGFIKYRNRWVMQNEVIFYKINDIESPKKKYLTSNLSEYKIADKLYHCIHYSGGNGRLVRANLVIQGEGCIKEYVWYDRASSYNKLRKKAGETEEDFGERKFPSTTVYHKEGDGLAINSDYFKEDFTKKMAKYLAANKVLAKKVKSKQSGYTKILNLRSIFAEYNESCE